MFGCGSGRLGAGKGRRKQKRDKQNTKPTTHRKPALWGAELGSSRDRAPSPLAVFLINDENEKPASKSRASGCWPPSATTLDSCIWPWLLLTWCCATAAFELFRARETCRLFRHVGLRLWCLKKHYFRWGPWLCRLHSST